MDRQLIIAVHEVCIRTHQQHLFAPVDPCTEWTIPPHGWLYSTSYHLDDVTRVSGPSDDGVLCLRENESSEEVGTCIIYQDKVYSRARDGP